MAFYSDTSFSTYQGRAKRTLGDSKARDGASLATRLTSEELQRPVPRKSMRLPIVTLVLGSIAALAIVAGALNHLPTGSVVSELENIEITLGRLPQ
ncbi:hypothetical protein AQS8620_01562 [Aquimixticola soesokkakensis]|uniref:Uncharacterized protein n=1 Tax=Aquimixticola soesokkakensis TaxID=1519096 RepID=A0A1Y5SM16_9RHOB|nr:hypothetical protein [Aquimixticola soesokkakensis]SLN40889.1 hypothetical protein AQS8620_01562 [Aquimixticola soesokkakensis]